MCGEACGTYLISTFYQVNESYQIINNCNHGRISFFFVSTDEALISNLITHGVSIVFLAMLNCSNSVLVRGVYIDAEEQGGQCVIFPVYYIRLYFQKERTKKQRRLLDADKGQSQQQPELLLEMVVEKTQPQIVKNANGEHKLVT